MTTYFTSDWHLDHNNILSYSDRTDFMTEQERFAHHEYRQGGTRPKYRKETLDRMNDTIIDNINAVVKPDDVLWNLGDVLFASKDPHKYFKRLRGFRNRIRCKTINLIWGNHDKQLRWWGDSAKCITREQLFEIFNDAYEQTRIVIDGQKIVLNHYAMAVWQGNHSGVWHLYGHSHGHHEAWREEHMPQAKAIDVGIDYRNRLGKGYTPWSFDELKEYMDSKE